MKYYEVKIGTKTEEFIEGSKTSKYIAYLGYIRKNIRENRESLNPKYHLDRKTEEALKKLVMAGELESEYLRFSHFEDAVEVSMALGGRVDLAINVDGEAQGRYKNRKIVKVAHSGAYIEECETEESNELDNIHTSLKPIIARITQHVKEKEEYFDLIEETEPKYEEYKKFL